MTREKIRDIVISDIEKYGTRDPFVIADYRGIHVSTHRLAVNGFYAKVKGCDCIALRRDLSNRMLQYRVMAHELGHAVLHDWAPHPYFASTKYTDRVEREADIYAAELLVPDDIWYDYPGYTCQQIADAEGIDPELLEIKYNAQKNAHVGAWTSFCF